MPQAGTTKIVFTSNRDGRAQIYSMDSNGSNLTRLTNNLSNDDHPRWSPNGTKILFQSDRDNPETGNQDVYVMNADGTGQTRLTTDAADDCNAVWSPDGTKIVFQSLRNGTYYQVYVMNADGSGQVNRSNGTSNDYQPNWSPNGSKIAFASERDHAGAPSIYSMNPDGSSQTRLTFSSELVRDEQPVWSRDATKIAFASTRDGNKEIYVMNADGSNPSRLTNTLENDDSPYWSSDGTKIVFRSERERDSFDPMQQLWGMNADGSSQTIISSNEFGDYSPSWNTNATGNQSPVANSGGPYSGVIAQNVPFSGIGSFDSDGTITSYAWIFGDGGTSSGVSPTHAYAAAGTYNISLTVTDNLGAQTSAATTATVTTAGSEQYVANFSQWALNRAAYTNESSYWNDILRAAYPNGQTSMVLSLRELGRTLFESSEYAARGRDNHWYLYDLYKTYLMREPDAPGWAFWENELTLNHLTREEMRRDFGDCGEFFSLVATMTPSGSPSSTVSSLASARIDPFNQPGNGLASRDAEWSVPLLSLPGRADLDLGLSLSYSSMIWTRSGPYIYFDEDNGWPSPGFRLGFPTIQEKFFDAQAGRNVSGVNVPGRNVYLMTAGGSRVSLRQVDTSNVYEAADSSYLQLIDNGGSLLLRTTDGTQLSYVMLNKEWRCTQIKDRNGNYITVNYDWLGHITTIIDTLARTITFNYDTNANLTSITQQWNGQPPPHTWASFVWEKRTIDSSAFSGVSIVGAATGFQFPGLKQVGFDDGTYCKFLYNSAGQVTRITHYASDSNPLSDNHPRNYTAFEYNSAADDCPRVSATHVWAENWTGINGVPQEIATIYGVEGNAHTVYVVGDPNSTLYKEFYGTDYRHGLTTQTEVWSGGIKQKWTTTSWTQDNTGVNYQTNPRVTESNIYDGTNHRRTSVSYSAFTLPSGASCTLPKDVREYAGNATTMLRRSHMDYRMDPTADAAYLDRHIIGLVREQSLYEVDQVSGAETLMSKVGYQYDETGSIQGDDAPVSHDNDPSNGYRANFVTGRANLSSVKRYDVADSSQFSVSSLKYNTAGAVVTSIDPLAHQSSVSYADSFSDNNSRNTLAYPTTATDADSFSTTIQYNFDFGARTRIQGPPPQNQPQGLIQTFTYDTSARIDRVTTMNNGAYTRYVYGPNYVQSFATVNNVADEAYSNAVFDGAGRTILTASNHPGSLGGYSARNIIYDLMGRAVKQSNPTETNGSWNPYGDDLAGWLYTQQTYDWKGRPLVTTNTDGTTKEANYSGCGCAGGEVVTLMDEGTIDAGVAKRRQQKIYADVLGRTVKSEVLNWQGGSVYSTTVNAYNGRDQIKLVRQYQGDEASGVYQDTTMTYDGFGRLKTQHSPEQDDNTATSWNYNPDDTVSSVTDARGASATYDYSSNNRRLVNSITYSAPAGITPTSNVSFGYDAVGNRTSMSDGLGTQSYTYDSLSRITSETRYFGSPLNQSFTFNYVDYNLAGELKTMTDPWGATINYGFDSSGRLSNMTGSGYGSVSQFLNEAHYRAWGTLKSETYGNGFTETAAYNARLQITSFDVRKPSGEPQMSSSYQYYADGNLKLSHNALDERFDRAYAFDHAARAIEAYSGSEARDYAYGTSSGTTTGPYRQSYQYNAFNQITQQTNRLWSSPETTPHTFVNNRITGWVYDASGRITQDDSTAYAFDAAGRSVHAGSETSQGAYSYDGDGQLLKTVLTTPGFHGGTRTTTVYSLRSSVLGLVVAELNSAGQKTKRYIYAGNRKLAEEKGSSITWSHKDPVTDSRGDSGTTGFYTPKAEFNADGINVGFSPPDASGFDIPEPIAPWGNLGLGSNCSVGNPNCVTCLLDGIEHDCGHVRQLAAAGALQIQLQNRQGETKLVDLDLILGQLGYSTWDQTHHRKQPPPVSPDGILRVNNQGMYIWHTLAVFMPTFSDDSSGERRFAHAPQRGRPHRDPCVDAIVDATLRALQDAARQSVPIVLQNAREAGLTAAQTAYVFGTMVRESQMGNQMTEGWGPTPAQRRYEPPSQKATQLGNTQPGDGRLFSGRGYVMITGRTNYQDWTDRLGIDLVGNPNLALVPATAAHIAVYGMRDGTFTNGRERLSDYINENGTDFTGARAIVNGSDHAGEIAGYARGYQQALINCGYGAPQIPW